LISLTSDPRWRLKESIEDMALFVRNDDGRPSHKLIEVSRQPAWKESYPKPLAREGSIALLGMKFPEKFSHKQRIFPMTMYWGSLSASKNNYPIEIKVVCEGKTYYNKRRLIGSIIYPTFFWKPGEYVKEDYYYLLPYLKPGEYTIKIKISPPSIGQKYYNAPELQKTFIVD
jgi:hypothetical protein